MPRAPLPDQIFPSHESSKSAQPKPELNVTPLRLNATPHHDDAFDRSGIDSADRPKITELLALLNAVPDYFTAARRTCVARRDLGHLWRKMRICDVPVATARRVGSAARKTG